MSSYQTQIQNTKLSLFPFTLQQQNLTHSNILTVFQIIVSIGSLNYILAYDSWGKKSVFGIALMLILLVADNNVSCARTSVFLLNLISSQIILIALTSKFLSMLTKLPTLSHLIPNYPTNTHRYNYTFMILILFLTNLLGFIYCLVCKYHEQLYQYPQLIIMLGMVLIGFIMVAIADYTYVRVYRQNIKMSTRRKIFHFVPVGLLPILVNVHYKLFTLMVFGSFYLFWVLEILRYYGKLAKNQKIYSIPKLQSKDNYKGITQLNIKQINYDNVLDGVNDIKDGNRINIIVVITKYLNIANVKITQLPLIKWMEQLNLARQPYFWFTHLSLILGLSLTYIYYSLPSHLPNIHNNSRNSSGIKHSHSPSLKQHYDSLMLQSQISQNMSIILVIADAMAAIIGKKYGKKQHTIPNTNNKTVQGYIGFALTTIILQLILYIGLFCWCGYSLWNIDYIFIILNGIGCALGQLFSGDMDNIVIGIVFIGVDWAWNRGSMLLAP